MFNQENTNKNQKGINYIRNKMGIKANVLFEIKDILLFKWYALTNIASEYRNQNWQT